MEKKEFLSSLDSMLKPNGYKRKGNRWITENDQLKKVVQLQKSKFGNSYYLNYGYIIKKLKLNNLEMHVYNRLSSVDDCENKRIMDLLDFENGIRDDERLADIQKMLEVHILDEIQQVNSEQDLVTILKNRPHLNDVPLVLKKHYGLEEK